MILNMIARSHNKTVRIVCTEACISFFRVYHTSGIDQYVIYCTSSYRFFGLLSLYRVLSMKFREPLVKHVMRE